MGGFDDHVAIIGDWVPPSPSPRAFFSALLGDEISSRPISEPPTEIRNEALFPGSQEQIISGRSNEKEGASDQPGKSNLFNEQKMNSRGGLLERMAARAGFNAPRLNTENIRSTDVSLNPDIRSPYLTIPPGLSPTTLLESPVFLSNSLVQPSPTTGKLPFVLNVNSRNSMPDTESTDKSKDNFFEDISNSSFAFKPPVSIAELDPSFFLGAASKQNLPSIEVSVQQESSLQSRNVNPPKVLSENETAVHVQDFSRPFVEKDASGNTIMSDPVAVDAVGGSTEHSSPLDELQEEEADQKGGADAMVGGASSDDGYNWRKYGQKQVKGSEYPRSYYKCTHPNCPVKKKVERSPEGHITEIIYKGAHNHPKPPPNRRSTIGPVNVLSDPQMEAPDQTGVQVGVDGDPIWRHDNLEVTSSASVGADLSNVPNLVQGQGGTHFDSGDTVDGSSTFSNDEDEDDQVTHGSVSLGYDEDESESKRRKIEAYATEMSGATRAIREPRVVVQTTSEVDILDDGYRWRKYGQKVVKGNPNPRSYYKCTSAGCTVRKHVERASHDLKSVITTYEGKHNHDVPAARNSSHGNPGAPSNGTALTATQPGAAAVPPHLHRPEASQVHNSLARFGLPGRPPLRGPHGFGFGFGFGFGMGQPNLANLAMAGLGPNGSKLSVLPVHPYLGQQRPVNEMGFMPPKGELKVEPLSDPPSLNLPNASSVYQQIMSRLPLGPQM